MNTQLNLDLDYIDSIVKKLIKYYKKNIFSVIETRAKLPSKFVKLSSTCNTYLMENPIFLFKIIDIIAHILLKLDNSILKDSDCMLLLQQFDNETIIYFKTHSDKIIKYLTQGVESLEISESGKELSIQINNVLNKIFTKILLEVLDKCHGFKSLSFENLDMSSEDFRKYILLEHFLRKLQTQRRHTFTRRDLVLLWETNKDWAAFIVEKIEKNTKIEKKPRK